MSMPLKLKTILATGPFVPIVVLLLVTSMLHLTLGLLG